MITTWWFGIEDDSELCGEEFFVEVDVPMDIAKATAIKNAKSWFIDYDVVCYGRISQEQAETMGLDTY